MPKQSKRDENPVLNNYTLNEKDSTYYCNECEYSSKLKAYVRQHMISHSSDRPFVCHFMDCDITYKRSSELKRHIKVFHLGEKQFKCCICGKEMTQIQTLKDHISSIHLKLKPFVCDINGCGQSFSILKNLRDHQKRRHLNCGTDENHRKNKRQKTRADSDVSIGDKNDSHDCPQTSDPILKTERKYDNNNNIDYHLFECNFFGCNYNTYVWEQISQHFVNHWNSA